MTPGIAITLIICGTILILSIMSTITKVSTEKKSREFIDKSVNKITKTLETPEMLDASDKDYFTKF